MNTAPIGQVVETPARCTNCSDPIGASKWPDGIRVTLHGKEMCLCVDCFDLLKEAIIYQDDQ